MTSDDVHTTNEPAADRQTAGDAPPPAETPAPEEHVSARSGTAETTVGTGGARRDAGGAAPTRTPLIAIRDLHKQFRIGFGIKKVHAVRGISLEVRPGQIFGFLGPNGAGKTTTIKVLTGLFRPTSGEVRLFGEPVGSLEARKRIGYLPEQPYFYDYLEPEELLDYYGKLFGVPKAVRRRRIDELIELVGLDHAKDRTLRRFSKGMLQRIGIAQALMGDPELVILDEPLSGLDPSGRKHLRDIIATLKARGKTVFFSSHILSDIEMICDEVAIIAEGVIKRAGRLDDLLSRDRTFAEIYARLPETSVDAVTSPEVLGEEGSWSRLGEIVQLTVEAPRVDGCIRAVQSVQGTVVSVDMRREGLEDLFMREAFQRAPEEGEVTNG